MIRRRLGAGVSALLLASAAGLLGEQAWLGAKAQLAERLIQRAFEAHLEDGAIHRPWSWADTHPVARLEVPRLGVVRTVLAGASGSSLAFGPGHIDGTAPPNGAGNCAVAGHRDAWFSFLRHLRPGDEIRLTTRDGTRRWRVDGLAVRSMWDGGVLAPSPSPRLTLITCYPFDALVGGPERYVVTCRPVEDRPAGSRTAGDGR